MRRSLANLINWFVLGFLATFLFHIFAPLAGLWIYGSGRAVRRHPILACIGVYLGGMPVWFLYVHLHSVATASALAMGIVTPAAYLVGAFLAPRIVQYFQRHLDGDAEQTVAS